MTQIIWGCLSRVQDCKAETSTYKKRCWQWLQLRLVQPVFLLLEFQSVQFLQFCLLSCCPDIQSNQKIRLQFGQFLQLNIILWKGSILYPVCHVIYCNISDRSLAYNWNILLEFFRNDILPMVLHWLRFRHIFGRN